MKRPDEIDVLSAADLDQVQEIVDGIETWFAEGHDTYYVNWFLDRSAPERVWREVVKRASEAEWDATLRGAIVEIRK